jgi:hypothetical protein
VSAYRRIGVSACRRIGVGGVVFYWRTASGQEVDIVLENPKRERIGRSRQL